MLARASAYQKAHPEMWRSERARKSRKEWRQKNRKHSAEWRRSWRSNNREKVLAADQKRRERQRGTLYRRVSGEILTICRDDPRRAVGLRSVLGLGSAICLECGEVHPSLAAHIARHHRMPTNDYRHKWGYAKHTSLSSANFSKGLRLAMQRRVRKSRPIPPPLVKGSAVLGRRSWGVSKEVRLNLRDRYLGIGIGARSPESHATKPRGAHRPASRDADADKAIRLQAQHPKAQNPKWSWARIAREIDPKGFAQNPRATTDRIRLAVAYRQKKKSTPQQ